MSRRHRPRRRVELASTRVLLSGGLPTAVRQARPAHAWSATRSCSSSRSARPHHRALRGSRTPRRSRFAWSVARLALVHRAVRQLRRGGGRGPRQGAGRHAAQDPHGDTVAPRLDAAGRHRGAASRRPQLRRRRPSWSSGRRDDPRRRRRRRGHRDRSTSRRSPASRHRSSASPAATARPSPAARGCCPTGSSCASRSKPGETFLDRMIALVEGAARQKTPNEIALNILLAGLTIIFLLAVVTLQPFAIYSERRAVDHRARRAAGVPDPDDDRRAARRRSASPAWTGSCSATCWRCRAARSRPPATCTTLLLDKTGTITFGNRQAAEFLPVAGVDERASSPTRPSSSSLADETPEGRSIVVLRQGAATACASASRRAPSSSPFTAQTRMSGVDLADGAPGPQGRGRLGRRAGSSEQGGTVPTELDADRRRASPTHGGTPLVVAEADGRRAPPRRSASSTSRTSSRRACASASTSCARMGIRTVMITGDNPLTAAAIADEAGVDDFLAEATPEDKMALIKRGAGGRPPRRDDRRRHQRRARRSRRPTSASR